MVEDLELEDVIFGAIAFGAEDFHGPEFLGTPIFDEPYCGISAVSELLEDFVLEIVDLTEVNGVEATWLVAFDPFFLIFLPFRL